MFARSHERWCSSPDKTVKFRHFFLAELGGTTQLTMYNKTAGDRGAANA